MEDIEAYFADFGQRHVFQYKDSLSQESLAELVKQARTIDFPYVLHLKQAQLELTKESMSAPEFIPLPEFGGDTESREHAKLKGEEAIRLGKLAAVTAAGGQGTRLGFDGPKGAFPATAIKQKSLFQVFAEKIQTAQNRYQVTIPWFIMTSEQNHHETIIFFEKHHNFGLTQIHLFEQGLIPVFDNEGKLLMEAKGRIALSPNGHGGIFSALSESHAFERMAEHGVEILSYFQVDNPLVHCIDPVFIGFHLMHESEMSSKMVRKTSANEKVGVFCQMAGKLQLVEYTDMPTALNEDKDQDGNLVYSAGNPAIHLIERQFAQRIAQDEELRLPYHRAKKCVLALDSSGNIVKPEVPNAVKWEMFIFDALSIAKNAIIFETACAEEFSPIKNAEGFASAKTSLADQNSLFAQWLEQAGVGVPRDPSGTPLVSIEISPLFADNAESFIEAWNALEQKPQFQDNTYLYQTS